VRSTDICPGPYPDPVLQIPRSARLAAWGTAWLQGRASTGGVVRAVTGTSALARSRNYAEHDTIHIEVTGLQFQWYFRYPGADGAFGETKPSLIDASVGNPLGLDATDVYAHDDIVSAYAVVPIGRTIDVSLRAQDVIHSFYVPAFRIKQDAVPGLNPHVRFTPDHLGSYDVTCAELCGLGHYRMFSRIEVVSEPDYYRWLAQRAPSASSPGGGE